MWMEGMHNKWLMTKEKSRIDSKGQIRAWEIERKGNNLKIDFGIRKCID